MSDFEKYIKENQRKFDLDQINPKVWQTIEAEIKEKKGAILSLRNSLRLVAAVLICVFCFQWFGDYQKVNFPKHLLEDYGFKDSKVDELLDAKIITIREASIPVAYKGDLEMLLNQVTYLDQHFAEKINKLDLANTEVELLKEILEYYKTKSEILDRVINEIQKVNTNEKKYKIKSEKTKIRI